MSKKEDASSALTLILLFIVFFIAALVFSVFLFLVAPGAAITALIAYLLGQQIDLGQAWVFAIAISAVIIFGYHLFFRNPKGTQNAYLFTCTIVAGIYALASLGFHAGWANAHLAYFLPYLMGTQENRAMASEQTSSGQPAQEQKTFAPQLGQAGDSAQGRIKEVLISPPMQEVAPAPPLPIPLPLGQTTPSPQDARLLQASTGAMPLEQKNHPSFDCDKAQLPVERMICASEKLSAMDRRLQGLYREVRLSAPSGQIKMEQIQWLKRHRNVCEDVVCLLTVYEDRIDHLQRKVAEK